MRKDAGQEPAEKKDKKTRIKTPDQAHKTCQDPCQESCAETHAKNIWIVGCVAITLVTIFCVAIMNSKNNSPAQLSVSQLPDPMMSQGVAMTGPGLRRIAPMQPNFGGQGLGAPYCVPAPMTQWGMGLGSGLHPRAIYGPNCPIYPNYAQPMPQYGAVQSPAPLQQNGPVYPNYAQPLAQDPSMQQVAVTNPHAGCPSFTQCFPPAGGGAQPVAFTNPHAGCPSFTQCFPQGSATAVALTNPVMGAAARFAPPIFRDAVIPHAFRGVCENCHIVNPDIPISINAQLPHEFRGVCSNCHVISDLPPAV